MDIVSIILSVCMLKSHCNLAFSLYAIDSTVYAIDHLPLHGKWYYPHKRQWTFLLSLSQLFWYWLFSKLGHTLLICVSFSVFFLHITMVKHSGCQCYVWWICFQMLFLRFINQGLYFHFWFSSSEPNQNLIFLIDRHLKNCSCKPCSFHSFKLCSSFSFCVISWIYLLMFNSFTSCFSISHSHYITCFILYFSFLPHNLLGEVISIFVRKAS